MKRKELLTRYKTDVVGADATSVRCKGEMAVIGVSAEQALADLARLKTLIHSRQPQERYANARKPPKGKRFDVAYRMRNLF